MIEKVADQVRFAEEMTAVQAREAEEFGRLLDDAVDAIVTLPGGDIGFRGMPFSQDPAAIRMLEEQSKSGNTGTSTTSYLLKYYF